MRRTSTGRARRGRRWRSERGQSTALVTSMLMVLMLFVGVVVDVGQAVNRRVALQVVADAGAYTGAAVMATGMNQMAYWNLRIQDAWAVFSDVMFFAFTIHNTECYSADAAEAAYTAAWYTFNTGFQAASKAYANFPYMEAKRVSIYNINDLFPGESDRFKFAEWSLSPETGIIPMQRDLMDLVSTEQVPDGTSSNSDFPSVIPSQRSLTYACESFPPPRFEIRNRNYDVWYQRSDDNEQHFVWIVAAPRTKALMFDSLFGGDIIPEMRAAAVAKPVGGNIKRGESEYVTKMELLSKVMTFSGGGHAAVLDDKYDRGFRPVVH